MDFKQAIYPERKNLTARKGNETRTFMLYLKRLTVYPAQCIAGATFAFNIILSDRRIATDLLSRHLSYSSDLPSSQLPGLITV